MALRALSDPGVLHRSNTVTDTDNFLVRTVPASVPATGSAIGMVSRGEYHVSILVEIIVFFFKDRLRTREHRPDFVHRHRVIRSERKFRGGLKTTPAQACRIEAISGQDSKDLTRHDDLVTPAKPLVKMTLRHPALVVTAAHRALLIMAQCPPPGRGKRGLILRVNCFHDLLARMSLRRKIGRGNFARFSPGRNRNEGRSPPSYARSAFAFLERNARSDFTSVSCDAFLKRAAAACEWFN
jgi:hypothetical protein